MHFHCLRGVKKSFLKKEPTDNHGEFWGWVFVNVSWVVAYNHYSFAQKQ